MIACSPCLGILKQSGTCVDFKLTGNSSGDICQTRVLGLYFNYKDYKDSSAVLQFGSDFCSTIFTLYVIPYT